MQEALSVNIPPLDIYYLGRTLNKSSPLKDTINFKPYLENLGCKIFIEPLIEELDISKKNNRPFVKILGIKDFEISIPSGAGLLLERFLLALGLSHFILHGETGKKPCFVSKFSTGKVGLEAFYFAIGITSNLEYIEKARYNGLNIYQISNLFVLPNFAVDVAINGLLDKHSHIFQTHKT